MRVLPIVARKTARTAEVRRPFGKCLPVGIGVLRRPHQVVATRLVAQVVVDRQPTLRVGVFLNLGVHGPNECRVILEAGDRLDLQLHRRARRVALSGRPVRSKGLPAAAAETWRRVGVVTQDVRRVLYRLPQLLAAALTAIVFIVEGEKDVDRLVKAGLVATCNAGGADDDKLDQRKAERDRLQAQLEAQAKPRTASRLDLEQKVEARIEVLRNLRQAIRDADPEDLRELLRGVVSRIELSFDRHQAGKYTRSTFREGDIHVRPEKLCSDLCNTASTGAARRAATRPRNRSLWAWWSDPSSTDG